MSSVAKWDGSTYFTGSVFDLSEILEVKAQNLDLVSENLSMTGEKDFTTPPCPMKTPPGVNYKMVLEAYG